MKKIELGQAVTILANLGVIAGIIFLAIEIRQNNELMADEAQRVRSESIRECFVMMADNGELAAIQLKDLEGEELSNLEEFRLSQYLMRGVIGYQTSFHQLPREELEPMANYFRGQFETSSSFRRGWRQYRDALDPAFVQYMEEDVAGGP